MKNLKDVYELIEAAEDYSSKHDYTNANKLHNEVVTTLQSIIDKDNLNDDVIVEALRRLLNENRLQALQCKYRSEIERIKQLLLEKESQQLQKDKQIAKSDSQHEDASGILNTEYSLILNSSYKLPGIGGDISRKYDLGAKNYIVDLFESLEISPIAHDDYDMKHNHLADSSIQKINYKILESKSKEELVMENIQLKQNIYNQNRLLERFYLKTGPQNTDKDIVLIDKKQFMKQLFAYFSKSSSKPESPGKPLVHNSRYLKNAPSSMPITDASSEPTENKFIGDYNKPLNSINHNSHHTGLLYDIIRDYSRISPKRNHVSATNRDQHNSNSSDIHTHKPIGPPNVKINKNSDTTKFSNLHPLRLSNRTKLTSYSSILHSDDDSDEDEENSDIEDESSCSAPVLNKMFQGSQRRAHSGNNRLVNEFAKYMR